MKLPRNFTSRSFMVVGASVVLYAAAALAFGWDDFSSHLRRFPLAYIAPLLFLTMINYALRYWRWSAYLDALDIQIPRRTALKLYFSTYVMVITPGKIGEVFKAGIMRERFDVPLAKGLPAVLAERIFDFLSVFALAVVGVVFWPAELTGLATGLVLSAAFPAAILLLRDPRIRSRLVSRAARSRFLARYRLGIDEASGAFDILFGLRLFTFSMATSCAAWFAECTGLWLVCRGLGFELPLAESVFVYAAGTLVGSLTFLPGGLGGTEATMIWLLGSVGMAAAQGATAALLIRLFTLWLAVVIGGLFLIGARELFRDTTR